MTINNSTKSKAARAIISYLYLSQKLITELGAPGVGPGIGAGPLGGEPGTLGEPGGGLAGGGVPTRFVHCELWLIVTLELLNVPSALNVAIFKH